MSTGFYTRVSNTVLSGNDLLASLSGDDVRALQYEGRTANGPVKLLSTIADGGNTLNANEWVDSVNTQLLISPTANVSCAIILGSDMPSIAKQYQNLFNLTTTSQVRTCKFELASENTTAIYLRVGATTGAGTFTYVQCATDGTAASGAILFSSTGTTGGSWGCLAGRTRTVLVSGSTFTSGSEVVTFNVLSGSL